MEGPGDLGQGWVAKPTTLAPEIPVVPHTSVIGLTDWIAPLRSAMTRPTFKRLRLLALAWLLTDRPGTITAALLASGLAHTHHHANFYRALQAAWEPDDVGKSLLKAVVETFYEPDQVVRLTLDDTLLHHNGAFIDAVGCHLDPVRSSRGYKTFAFGHVWVMLTVLIDVPGSSRSFALPVMLRLYLPKSTAEHHERDFRKKTALAADILRSLAESMPGRRFLVANDEVYCCRRVAAALGDRIEMVGRMRRSAALTEAAPPPDNQRGRPRKKGARLPRLSEIYDDDVRWPWQQMQVVLGGRLTTLRYKTLRAQQYGVFGERLLRVVLVDQPQGSEVYRVYFTTANASAQWTIERYLERWSQEVTHRELKQELGWGGGQVLHPRSVARLAPFVAFLYTVVVAWFAKHAAGQAWARWRVGPWYTHKRQPSFRDMLLAARAAIRAATDFLQEVDDDDFPQVFRDLATAAATLPGPIELIREAA